jgi:leucyl-tRNA synthetase
MVMYDKGLVGTEEPFPKFFAHGLMIKDGAKMSKSRGNVVNPDTYVKKFGADVMRMYEMFLGPMDGSPDFRDSGIEGMERFLGRVWRLFQEIKDTSGVGLDSPEVLSKVHQTIKGVTEDIKLFKYNTAIAKIMQLVNLLSGSSIVNHESLIILCKLLAPFAPHMMEEVWVEVLHQPFSIHKDSWPVYDPKMIVQSEVTIMIQINGKVRGQFTIDNVKGTNKEEVEKMAKEDERIIKHLEGQNIKKAIFVAGKLINFVI